jgi:hypothetical protein
VSRGTLVPRLLYWLVIVLAAALFVLVLLAPVLDNGSVRLLALFAGDPVVRRTALASGIGLIVTACIFFRVPRVKAQPRKPSPVLPPRPPVVGA